MQVGAPPQGSLHALGDCQESWRKLQQYGHLISASSDTAHARATQRPRSARSRLATKRIVRPSSSQLAAAARLGDSAQCGAAAQSDSAAASSSSDDDSFESNDIVQERSTLPCRSTRQQRRGGRSGACVRSTAAADAATSAAAPAAAATTAPFPDSHVNASLDYGAESDEEAQTSTHRRQRRGGSRTGTPPATPAPPQVAEAWRHQSQQSTHGTGNRGSRGGERGDIDFAGTAKSGSRAPGSLLAGVGSALLSVEALRWQGGQGAASDACRRAQLLQEEDVRVNSSDACSCSRALLPRAWLWPTVCPY